MTVILFLLLFFFPSLFSSYFHLVYFSPFLVYCGIYLPKADTLRELGVTVVFVHARSIPWPWGKNENYRNLETRAPLSVNILARHEDKQKTREKFSKASITAN